MQWKHPILLMKYSMKAHSINYERGNEYTWPNKWNIIESTKGWLWKAQWKHPTFLMKYSMKGYSINYEKCNESTQYS